MTICFNSNVLQIQIQRNSFQDLKVVCDIDEYECLNTWLHPIIQMDINSCDGEVQMLNTTFVEN